MSYPPRDRDYQSGPPRGDYPPPRSGGGGARDDGYGPPPSRDARGSGYGPPPSSMGRREPPKVTLFVAGFPPEMRAADLAYYFERLGPLVRCDIPALRSMQSKPYAFIEYEDPRDAAAAHAEMHGVRFGGFAISIQFAKNAPSANWRFDGAPQPGGRGPPGPPGPPRRRRSPSPRRGAPRDSDDRGYRGGRDDRRGGGGGPDDRYNGGRRNDRESRNGDRRHQQQQDQGREIRGVAGGSDSRREEEEQRAGSTDAAAAATTASTSGAADGQNALADTVNGANDEANRETATATTTTGDVTEESEASRPRENDLTPPPAVEAGGDADQTED